MIDAFRVAVTISMASNAVQVLQAMSSHIFHTHVSAKALESQLTKVGFALGGVGAIWGATKIVSGLYSATKQAGVLNDELMKMKTSGPDYASRIKGIEKDSWKYALQVGVPVEHAVKTFGEVSTQLKDVLTDQSTRDIIMPRILNLQRALAENNAHYGVAGTDSEISFVHLLKAADMKGITKIDANGKEVIDIDKFNATIEMFFKMVTASKGLIKEQDLSTLMKYGSTSLKNVDLNAMPDYLESMVLMGASRLGVAMSAITKQFKAGTMSKGTMQNWDKQGITKEGRDWTADKKTGRITFTPEGNKRMYLDELNTEGGQASWFPKRFLPMLEATMTKDKDGRVQDSQVSDAIAVLFSTNTGQRLAMEMFTAQVQMLTTAMNVRNQLNSQDSQNIFKGEGMRTATETLENAWKNLKTAFGESGVSTVVKGINELANCINRITAELVAHPEYSEIALKIGLATAALLAVGGVSMIVSVMVTGLAMSILTMGNAIKLIGMFFSPLALLGMAVFIVFTYFKDAISEFLGLPITTWTEDIGNFGKNLGFIWMGIKYVAEVAWEWSCDRLGEIFQKIKDFVSLIPDFLGNVGEAAKHPGNAASYLGGKMAELGEGAKTGFGLFGNSATDVPLAPKQETTIQVNSNINIDGKKVGQAVTTHQTNMANRPSNGSSAGNLGAVPMYPNNGFTP